MVEDRAKKFGPLMLIANSSWYLLHYREKLIRRSITDGNYLINISPTDKSTEELEKISLHIAWNISRRRAFNLISSLNSLVKLFFILNVIKPKIVHSHTLKANLMTVACTGLLGIPCVLSFAGLGRLNSKSKSLALRLILKTIYLFSGLERIDRFKFIFNSNRTRFIFQNPLDLNIFKHLTNYQKDMHFISLIYGSGVPDRYFSKNKLNLIYSNLKDIYTSKIDGLIYSARLLKSKGISIFIEMAKRDPTREYVVFGDIDPSSKDSLSENEIEEISSNISNLRFFGHIKDPLMKYLGKPYALIVPSVYGEGMPRAIAEAMALGIPVISTQKASCEIFDDNLIYIVDSNRSDIFLTMINHLENDILSGDIHEKIIHANRFVYKELSESKVVEETIKVYNSIKNSHVNFLGREDLSRNKDWIAR